MLVLTRKLNQVIIINHNIKINLLAAKESQAKIGIDAPKNISIYREEIYPEIKKSNINKSIKEKGF